MKQDIKNISYSRLQDRADKELIYKIDMFLYQEIDSLFIKYLKDLDIDKTYYEILTDRDGIITIVVNKLMDLDLSFSKDLKEEVERYGNIAKTNDIMLKANEENADAKEYKYFFLVNEEFIKVLNKVKRYYVEEDKTKKKIESQKEKQKEEELKELLNEHFDYCFDIMKQKRPIDTILILMGSSDFRRGTIEDLGINVKEYKDFDKTFDKVLNEFKKHHKYDVNENIQQTEKLSFGWKLYGITKVIEGLFKM